MASATTAARRLAGVAAAVAGGGGLVAWWVRQGDAPSDHAGGEVGNVQRQLLVDHLHVTLTTPSPASAAALPTWFLGPSLAAPLAERGNEEDQRQPAEPPKQQQRPLLFLSCADPFVLENLVQDIFELRPEHLPHVTVDFLPNQVDIEAAWLEHESSGAQKTAQHLSLDKEQDASLQRGTVVLHLSLLLSLPTATVASNQMLQRVVDWLQRQAHHHELQIVLTATTPLALWRLQHFVQQQQQKEAKKEGDAHEELAMELQQPQEKTMDEQEEQQQLVFHLEVLGPNQAMLLEKAAALLEAPLPPAGQEEEKDNDETAPPTDTQEVAEEEQAKQQAAESAKQSLRLQEFLALRPSLGVLSQTSSEVGAVEALVAQEAERLRAVLNNATTDAAVLLWDVLHAIHGENVDMLSQGNVEAEASQKGVAPLAQVLQLCHNNFQDLEALLAAGWIEFVHAETRVDDALPVAQVQKEENKDEPDQIPPPTPAAPLPYLVCKASLEPFKAATTEHDDGGLSSVPLPASLTTPAAVTLAWRGLEMDPELAATMNVRADARHFVQEASLLQFHRQALTTEWAQLHQGREVLRARAPELSEEDFVSLQLELIRLERSAASRAVEMSLRAKRLRELHEKLSDVLPTQDLPSLDLLMGANESEEAGANHPWVPIEETVLGEMGGGVRGIPIRDVRGELEAQAKKEKKTSTPQRRRWWWPFGRAGPDQDKDM